MKGTDTTMSMTKKLMALAVVGGLAASLADHITEKSQSHEKRL